MTAAAFCAQSARATDLPLNEDFEGSTGGFTPSSATWKWGVPSTGPGGAHSGTQAWGTNLTGNYLNDEDATLTSSDYDLSAIAGKWIVVHWWQAIVTEAGYDDALVEVSNDSGGTWEPVFGPRSGEVSAGWTQQTVLLDPSYTTANFRIRFRLVSDSLETESGFYVDDLRISAATLTERVALENFEAGDGGYAGAGVNSTWEYGTPVSVPGGAHSGVAAWATGLDGFYAASENSALASPSYDLTAAAGELIIVSWWQFIETEEGFDFTGVELSKDGGATWAAPLFSGVDSGPVTGGKWARKQAFVDPSFATAGFRVRFTLEADENFQFNGFAIDDVAIHSTGGLFPVASGFARSTPMDLALKFTAAHFLAAYTDPDGSALTAITIQQVPASGGLKLAGNPVIAGQEIPLSQLDALVYEPAPGASGPDPFTWTGANQFGASAAATVAVTVLGPTPEVVIANDPEGKTVNPGTSVTFEVVALSTTALTYQWRRNQGPILGANGASYTIGSVTEDHEGSYDVVVTNAIDEEISASASLSVNDPVTIVTPPVAFTVNEGDDAEFSVGATGTGRLDYQWLKNNQPIPDATFAVLRIDEATPDDDASYACVVTNVAGSQTTTAVALTVRLAPRIDVQPISVGRLVKRTVRLSVQASGAGNLTYQWLKNGEEIPGANGPVLELRELLELNSGDYTVRVSNDFGSRESEPAKLSVFQWRNVAGTYQDVLLLEDFEALSTTPYSGRVTATISAGGVMSVALDYRGSRYSFVRRIGEELLVEVSINKGGRPPLLVRLVLDPAAKTIAATVTQQEGAGEFHSTALLPRHVFHHLRNPAPQAGRFNLVLSPLDGAIAGPLAPAYALSTINKSGRAVLRLALPSGRTLAASAILDPQGRLPLYAAFSPGAWSAPGEVAGRLEVQGTPGAQTIGGTASWRETAADPRRFLPAPFGVVLEAVGSIYLRPSRGEPVLALPPGSEFLELEIDGPLPGVPLTRFVRVLNPNTFFVDPETVEQLRFRAGLNTGLVVATYFDVATNQRRAIKGVTLQQQGEVRGFVRGVDNAAEFRLAPFFP